MDLPRIARLKPQLHHLAGSRCADCGELSFPAALRCPACGNGRLDEYRFKGTGRLVSFTEVFHPPRDRADRRPYFVGLIRLDEGVSLLSQLTDVVPEELGTGAKMEMVIRKISDRDPDGPIVYGYKFRPMEEGPDHDSEGRDDNHNADGTVHP